MKGEQDNETDKRNKREQEKGPRGASRSKGFEFEGQKVQRLQTLRDINVTS